MTRNLKFWLAGAMVLLLCFSLIWSWWSNRGLITIHANKEPLGKVIDSIAWQGDIKLVTNLDRNSPVTLWFDKVPLTDALERLSGATDARWSVGYLFAPAQSAIKEALGAFANGQLPENWRMFRVGGGFDMFQDEDLSPIDPRRMKCAPAPTEQKLHSYLESFAQLTDAMAAVPKDWNPDLNKTLKEEEVPKVAKLMAKYSKSEMQETFILMGWRQREEGQQAQNNDDGTRRTQWRQGGGGPGGGRGNFNPEAMAKRVEQQIALLPPDRQAEARAQYEQERAFWQELRNLPEEERRKKMEEHMNDPAVQERMAKREDYRDSRSSPEKRVERAKRYNDRKQQIKNGKTQ